MGQRAAGTCYVKVDGTQLTVSGNCEAPLSDVKRETIAPGFYKEEDLAPYLKASVIFEPGFPIKKLVTGTDMTITCEFKNGKTYVLSGAYLVDEPTGKGEDGLVDLQFDGTKGVWQ